MNRKLTYEGPKSRLDQYLVGIYKNISRAYLQQIIEKGLVLVNQKVGKKGVVLHSGDEIQILPFIQPTDRIIEGNSGVKFDVLFEFKNYVVLDKPPFLATHPNQFDDKNSLANGLVARFPQTLGIGDDPLRPGIVHRLDSNTSGVMLAALTADGFSMLRGLFDQRLIHKTYVALVLGSTKPQGTIATDIAHHHRNIKKMVAVTSPNIAFRSQRRAAKTIFKTIENFGDYSLVEVKTLTGRMHQVRVHLASIGHPLVGDSLYQSGHEKNQDKLGLTRHFLHAVKIEFKDPWTDKDQVFESKLSQDLDAILNSLHKK